jgi:hypothetical protein
MSRTKTKKPNKLSVLVHRAKAKRLDEFAIKFRLKNSLMEQQKQMMPNDIADTTKENILININCSKQLILGVDPGEKGAIACIDKKSKELLFSFNFPLHEQWGHNIIEYNLTRKMLVEHLISIGWYGALTNIEVCFERVASYGQGNKSAFVFGCNSLGLLNWFHAEFNMLPSVAPNVWKAGFMLTHRPKSAAVEMSNKIFEKQFSLLDKTVKDQELIIGQADAALIGLFAANSVVVKRGVK